MTTDDRVNVDENTSQLHTLSNSTVENLVDFSNGLQTLWNRLVIKLSGTYLLQRQFESERPTAVAPWYTLGLI